VFYVKLYVHSLVDKIEVSKTFSYYNSDRRDNIGKVRQLYRKYNLGMFEVVIS